MGLSIIALLSVHVFLSFFRVFCSRLRGRIWVDTVAEMVEKPLVIALQDERPSLIQVSLLIRFSEADQMDKPETNQNIWISVGGGDEGCAAFRVRV